MAWFTCIDNGSPDLWKQDGDFIILTKSELVGFYDSNANTMSLNKNILPYEDTTTPYSFSKVSWRVQGDFSRPYTGEVGENKLFPHYREVS